MGHDIFVSYSSKDKLFVDALVNALENSKFRCWYAPRDIPAGIAWPSAISQAIKQTPVMLLVFSESANVSQEVSRELTLASNHKSLVIPVRIENVLPGIELEYHLTNRHWLDVYDMEREAALASVVEGVQKYGSLFQKRPDSSQDSQSDVSPIAPPRHDPEPLPEPRFSGKPYLIRLSISLFFAALAVVGSLVANQWSQQPAPTETRPAAASLSEAKPALDPETGKLTVFTGDRSVVVSLLSLEQNDGTASDQDFLVQGTGLGSSWDKRVFKTRLEVRGRQERYVATVNDQRFVLLITQDDGTGTFFLPDSNREYSVIRHEGRLPENAATDLLAAYRDQAKP